jgi:hypothetical protein
MGDRAFDLIRCRKLMETAAGERDSVAITHQYLLEWISMAAVNLAKLKE